MPPAGIQDLPFELLTEIIRDLESTKDLHRLRRVNKAFHSLATPVAFKTLLVVTKENDARRFLNLLNSPHIARHIQSITLVEAYLLIQERNEIARMRFERVRIALKAAFFILHQAPALKNLALFFNPNYYEDRSLFDVSAPPSRFVLLQWDVLGALARNPNPLPALRSFSIDNWLASPHPLYDEAPFTRLIASLDCLHLFVLTANELQVERAHEQESLTQFWEQVVMRRILQPAVNLKSLGIDSNLTFGTVPHLDFTNLATYPRLTTLSLRNAMWEDRAPVLEVTAPGVEDFIARHGATLKQLELRSCAIDIKNPLPRFWAAVWNRFTLSLSELAELTVEFRIDDTQASSEVQYVHLVPSFGVVPSEGLGCAEEDALALKAFKRAVKKRRMTISTGQSR